MTSLYLDVKWSLQRAGDEELFCVTFSDRSGIRNDEGSPDLHSRRRLRGTAGADGSGGVGVSRCGAEDHGGAFLSQREDRLASARPRHHVAGGGGANERRHISGHSFRAGEAGGSPQLLATHAGVAATGSREG